MSTPKNQVLCGDTLSELKKLPDECIDTIITSPPYWGLRNYGIEGQLGLEPTIEEYLEKMLEITAELKRVLKKTGSMFWNHGDSYCGGHPGGSIHGEITGDRYNESNIPQKTDGRPQGKMEDYQEKCLIMQNERLALKMIDEQGWILRNRIIWYKPNAMPSSVLDRFKNSYEPVYFFVKNNEPQYYYNTQIGVAKDRAIPIKVGTEGVDWRWLNGKQKSYWRSLRYYFDLDAVRLPHKTESLEKYQRQVNVGMGGGNKESKYFDTEFDGRIGGKRTPVPKWFLEKHGIDKDYKGKFDDKRKVLDDEGEIEVKKIEILDFKGKTDPKMEENGAKVTPKYAKGSKFEKKYGEPWDRFGKNTKKFKKQDNVPGKNSPTYKGFNDRYKQSVERYKEVMKDKGEITDHQNYKLTAGLRIKGQVGHPHGATPGDMWDIKEEQIRAVEKEGKIGSAQRIESFFDKYGGKTHPEGKNPGDLWEIPTFPFSEAHFAVFPEKLIEPMIMSSCPKFICEKCGKARVRIVQLGEVIMTDGSDKGKLSKSEAFTKEHHGHQFKQHEHQTTKWSKCNCEAKFDAGIVCDPFLGSGTVAVVAKRLGMNFIGIEINPKYVKMAEERIKGTPTPLF